MENRTAQENTVISGALFWRSGEICSGLILLRFLHFFCKSSSLRGMEKKTFWIKRLQLSILFSLIKINCHAKTECVFYVNPNRRKYVCYVKTHTHCALWRSMLLMLVYKCQPSHFNGADELNVQRALESAFKRIYFMHHSLKPKAEFSKFEIIISIYMLKGLEHWKIFYVRM